MISAEIASYIAEASFLAHLKHVKQNLKKNFLMLKQLLEESPLSYF